MANIASTSSSLSETPPTRIPVASMVGVYKIFKQKKNEVMALRGIDLTVYPGELIVIMGPSGSGKTTLLNVLCGIEKPNAGIVKIKGMEINKLRDEGIQKLLQEQIGIIFQMFNLIPSLTAAGNVELPMIVANKYTKEERKERIQKLLDEVDLGARASHRPSTLSGGEKQRLSIAMAFANDPAIIVADEPTASVDSVSAEKILDVFKHFMKSNPNKALIIVTHDPAVRKIADYTLVIRDGQFVRKIEKLQEACVENGNIMDDSLFTDISKSRITEETSRLVQPFRTFKLAEIRICPHCHSENIIKALDRNEVFCQIHDNQVLQRAAIFCKECNTISFSTVSAFDINKIKIGNEMNETLE